jgi:hypothetical protein
MSLQTTHGRRVRSVRHCRALDSPRSRDIDATAMMQNRAFAHPAIDHCAHGQEARPDDR